LGHKVIGLDEDNKLIDNFLKNVPPLPEPELEKLLQKNQSTKQLKYSTDLGEIKNCNVLWFTFDTPVDKNDEVDLKPIWTTLEKSLPYLKDGVLLVVTSQIPVGTSKKICEFVRHNRPDLRFGYVYTPENLRLGEALKCFFEPGRIVLGAEDKESLVKIKDIFSGIKADFLEMSPASAEMSKHAINAFLATSISFINDISDVCEKVGADVLEVTRALRSEPRIGPRAFLDAGLGFSGGTLGRDLKALMSACNNEFSLPVISSVFEKNQKRKVLVINKMKDCLGDLRGKTIAILGLTYKAGTRTLRRSRSLEIATELKNLGALLRLHDPKVNKEELAESGQFDFFTDLYEAVKGSAAVIVITSWPEFKKIDFQKLAEKVSSGTIFFDTSNFLRDNEKSIKEAGFNYICVGRE
jgi:UDPglucose 6-dehydrogenase